MKNPLNAALEQIYRNFSKDASKMLIITGVAGWTLSSLAQVAAILFNPNIKKEQKHYLIPQEFSDAVFNIGAFFLFTLAAKKTVSKMFSTGKFTTKSVKEFLNKNKDQFANKIGKLDFDLDDVLKVTSGFPVDDYYTSKNFGTTIATITAGVISSNIITPIIRNKTATKMQKKYLSVQDKEVVGNVDMNSNQQVQFKSLPINYRSSFNLKI